MTNPVPAAVEIVVSQANTPPAAPQVDPTRLKDRQLHKHGSPLLACRFDPTDRFVVFAAEDYRVWRWEIETDRKVELNGHESWVRALAFSSDGRTLVTGGYDGRLAWWPAAGEKPEPIRRIDAHNGWIRAVAISPDNRVIATAGNDLRVKLWTMDDGKCVHELQAHERHVYNVAFHPVVPNHLVSGDLMGTLCHWDVATGNLVRKLQVDSLHKYDPQFQADIGGFRGLTFSRDGKLLACAGVTNVTNAFAGEGNPCVDVWDWEAGKQKVQHLSKGKLRGVAWNAVIHPQQFTVAVSGGGGGGFILFWKLDQPEEFHQMKLPSSARDLALSASGQLIATAHVTGELRISSMV